MLAEIPELPPYQPTRVQAFDDLDRSTLITDYWNIDEAKNRLAGSFPSPLYRDAILRFYNSLAPQIAVRYQLGHKPIIEQTANDTLIHIPTKRYNSLNNRAFHSTEVAQTAVDLGTSLNLNQEECFILALAGLSHDYAHPVFSHVGENTIVSISQTAQTSDPELHTFLERGDYTHHEQNLMRIVRNPMSEINKYLKEVTDNDQFRTFEDAIQEQGKLGAVLKLADTAAYLDHDSQFFGFSEPGFNEYFQKILSLQGETLILRESTRPYGEKVVNNFLSYRWNMYQDQYLHPINVLLERMQSRALFDYIQSLPQGKTRMKSVHDLFRTPDGEAVNLMKRRLLVNKSAPNLAFFGMPYAEFSETDNPGSPEDDITQKSITVNGSNIRSKPLSLNGEDGEKISFAPSNPDTPTAQKSLTFHPPGHLSEKVAQIIKTITSSPLSVEDAYLLEYVYGENSQASWRDINSRRAQDLMALVCRDFSTTLKSSEVFTQV